MASFVLSFFPLDVLDEIWDLIESVSEGFLTALCREAESKGCCCCVAGLRPRYTSKVMSGRTVNLATLFLGRLRPPRRLTSTSCNYSRQ